MRMYEAMSREDYVARNVIMRCCSRENVFFRFSFDVRFEAYVEAERD